MNNKVQQPTGIFTNYISFAIPLVFDESLSYYEVLCNLLAYIKNEIVPALNNNAEALKECEEKIVELQNYVDNYFENLDVQQEINNKLDEMAENGELENIIASYLQVSSILAYNSINDLKSATNLTNGCFVETYGFYSLNDGGKCKYKIREIVNTDVVNDVTIIGLTNYPTLVAEIIPDNKLYCKQFGFIEDEEEDVPNDINLSILLNYIDGAEKIVVVDGEYYFENDVTIPTNVTLEIQGKIRCDGTFAMGGIIDADLHYIFDVNGTYTINLSKNCIGYPEWFGAKMNVQSIACENAINKCIATFHTTILQAGTYYVTDTINVESGNKTIKGTGNKTTICMRDRYKKIMHVGDSTFPSEVNNLPRYFNISDIVLTRSNVNNYQSGSIGLHTEYLLYGNFTNIISKESCDDFLINGVVATKFNNCTSFNTTLANGDTTRVINGFRVDGFEDIGLAGNNASLYINGCNASFGGITYDLCHGLNIAGHYRLADIYIDKFESAMPYVGIEINGNSTTSGNDIFITNCVIDGYKEHGIYIHGFSDSSNINIDGNYIAPSSSAVSPSNFGIRIENTGNTNVVNNQIICDPSPACLPIMYNSCVNVNSTGNMIFNSSRALFFNSSDNIRSMDTIRNTTIQNANEPAINCNSITRSYIYPSVNCNAGYVNGGVFLSNCNKNEINITMLKGIADGSGNFIKIDGVAVTTTGVSGTNLVSGIF